MPLALLAFVQGCFVKERSEETRIEFDEALTIGQGCSGALSSWRVSNVTDPKLPEGAAGGCDADFLFRDLEPNQTYTFRIEGYSGDELCWSGSCAVYAERGATNVAECGQYVERLCGL